MHADNLYDTRCYDTRCYFNVRSEGPGFKSQSRGRRVTVFGKLLTPIVPLFTKQRNWILRFIACGISFCQGGDVEVYRRQIERHAAATRVESGVEELTEIGQLFHAKFHLYQVFHFLLPVALI